MDELLKRLDDLASKVDDSDGGSHDFSHLQEPVDIPRLPEMAPLSHDYGELQEMEDLDEGVFGTFRTADIPIMFGIGALGTLSSAALKNIFAKLHDKWGSKLAVNEDGEDQWGHKGQEVDRAPDSPQAGGFGHRWKFGHDLFNWKEINWEQYKDLAKQSGTCLPFGLKAVYYWLSHLLQDTFSSEGLPLPGHSLIRQWLNPAKNHELLKFLGTNKMRDVAGAGLTNGLMLLYLRMTEHGTRTPNYRTLSLQLGANCVCLLGGLCLPKPYASLNHTTIQFISYYAIRLWWMERKLKAALQRRDDVLELNKQTLSASIELMARNEMEINATLRELEMYSEQIAEDIRRVDAKQAELEARILNNGEES